MEIQPDYKEFLGLLNAKSVEYVIIGAHALAFYGAPRFTGDLDILVFNNIENTAKLVDALQEFGFGSLGLTPEDFNKPDVVVQLGVAPVRIDILTSIDGVEWDEIENGRVRVDYGGFPVYIIGKNELKKNKLALGRIKDIADLEALGER